MAHKITKISFIYKKRTLVIIAMLILAVVIGLGLYLYRNVYQESIVYIEQNDNIEVPSNSDKNDAPHAREMLLSGNFQDGDAIHRGSGNVSVLKSINYEDPVLVFGDDFKVTNGPDLFVYLSPNMPDEPLGNFVSLGKLKNDSGSQAYNLPSNYNDYKTVVIWCRAFKVTFSTATLK